MSGGQPGPTTIPVPARFRPACDVSQWFRSRRCQRPVIVRREWPPDRSPPQAVTQSLLLPERLDASFPRSRAVAKARSVRSEDAPATDGNDQGIVASQHEVDRRAETKAARAE